ncbi:hypothetical protein NLJ89_g11335 [Agrocybe chaxingu]|uniref:Fatty acid hydroxylase domain-containing protein n=1 Tax=Agrocybe chaxingu TaxID=84603 RepID=A0A9W8MR94_9AGAR|nr:hypothetical protein NLJ89_g11335 [Agrocybe chaxingu]
MDVLLHIADDWLLDKAWAALVPLSAFSSAPDLVNAANSTAKFIPLLTPSSWSQLVSHLPHVPLNHDDLASLYADAQTLSQISAWPRNYIPRQLISVFVITLVGIQVLYFLFAGLSYAFIFNHEMMKHPRFLKNQVRQEIQASLWAFPFMTILMMPWFQAEVMGYSLMYDGMDTYGYTYLVLSMPLYLLFTDYLIYWIHRWLHIPVIYKYIHKPHHKWIIPTPFASYAFHPVDGYAQSLPYHLLVFVFPIHRILYLILFVSVNFWSIFIHDSDMITGHIFEKVINGPAHHTLHHIYFTVNYGQYFTWADRVGGSYRQPQSDLDPLLDIKNAKKDPQVPRAGGSPIRSQNLESFGVYTEEGEGLDECSGLPHAQGEGGEGDEVLQLEREMFDLGPGTPTMATPTLAMLRLQPEPSEGEDGLEEQEQEQPQETRVGLELESQAPLGVDARVIELDAVFGVGRYFQFGFGFGVRIPLDDDDEAGAGPRIPVQVPDVLPFVDKVQFVNLSAPTSDSGAAVYLSSIFASSIAVTSIPVDESAITLRRVSTEHTTGIHPSSVRNDDGQRSNHVRRA